MNSPNYISITILICKIFFMSNEVSKSCSYNLKQTLTRCNYFVSLAGSKPLPETARENGPLGCLFRLNFKGKFRVRLRNADWKFRADRAVEQISLLAFKGHRGPNRTQTFLKVSIFSFISLFFWPCLALCSKTNGGVPLFVLSPDSWLTLFQIGPAQSVISPTAKV